MKHATLNEIDSLIRKRLAEIREIEINPHFNPNRNTVESRRHVFLTSRIEKLINHSLTVQGIPDYI